MAFKDILFPEEVEFDFVGGPQFFTAINSTAGGFEQRNQNWQQTRHKFDASHSLKDQAELDTLKAFFMVLRGSAFSFRFKDWADYFNDDRTQGLCTRLGDGGAVGDGVETQFQINKDYDFGTETFRRKIHLPADQAVFVPEGVDPVETVYIDGTPQGAGFTIARTGPDGTGGVITFSVAPAVAEVIEWEGTFHVPARFSRDFFPITIQHFQIGSVLGIEVLEVRPEEDA